MREQIARLSKTRQEFKNNWWPWLASAFKLKNEHEDYREVVKNLYTEVVFRETNLWVLIFAILVASLGLNTNSTAVIIGAMLISPLMSPIIGIGTALAVQDFVLLRKAMLNYVFAVVVSLVASLIYFLFTPIREHQSEILARIYPTFYDVLIAFFGGLAGFTAVSSKRKGNILHGVAIATALMPPLCTAAYGLASGHISFFIGALYLFLINSVFIILAAYTMARYLNYPVIPGEGVYQRKMTTRKILLTIVAITLLPSLYLGYRMIENGKYEQRIRTFIQQEGRFEGDYLLSSDIDFNERKITLTYGGRKIKPDEIEVLRQRMKKYELYETQLVVSQGFSALQDVYKDKNFINAMLQMEKQAAAQTNMKAEMDSLNARIMERDSLLIELSGRIENLERKKYRSRR